MTIQTIGFQVQTIPSGIIEITEEFRTQILITQMVQNPLFLQVTLFHMKKNLNSILNQ